MIPTSAVLTSEDRRRKAPTDWLSGSMCATVSQKEAWLSSKTKQGKTDLIQHSYFRILSLKCMYNPIEYSRLPLALLLNCVVLTRRAYLAMKRQTKDPNKFIRANKQFKASSLYLVVL